MDLINYGPVCGRQWDPRSSSWAPWQLGGNQWRTGHKLQQTPLLAILNRAREWGCFGMLCLALVGFASAGVLCLTKKIEKFIQTSEFPLYSFTVLFFFFRLPFLTFHSSFIFLLSSFILFTVAPVTSINIVTGQWTCIIIMPLEYFCLAPYPPLRLQHLHTHFGNRCICVSFRCMLPWCR